MTAKKAYNELSTALLDIYARREAENIADEVLENITGKKKWERNMDGLILNKKQIEKLRKYQNELLTNKPVQYILNEAWFMGFCFRLNENVLIPRPETEELTQLIIRENSGIKPLSILDIGTGSGCIAIALKKKMPHALVTSVDISDSAIDTAKENANKLKADVNFLRLDFLNENEWAPSLGVFDIVVSNPPYIPFGEKDLLDKNVAGFEPGEALFVADDDPLIFYKKTERFCRSHLSPDGKIYLEVHEDYAQQVASLFDNTLWDPRIVRDMYGKNRMVFVGRRPIL